MAAIGIWVWLNPSKLITVLGAPSRFSSLALRVVSLFMDFLVLIPGLNESTSSPHSCFPCPSSKIRNKLSRKEEKTPGEGGAHPPSHLTPGLPR